MPKYPFGKRDARVQGVSIIQIVVDKEGVPWNPKLLKSISPLMGFAAMDAIKHWRFKPALLDGEPVNVFYNLTVTFRLDP